MKNFLVGMLALGILVGCTAKTNEAKKEEPTKVVKEEKKDTTQQPVEKKEAVSKYPFPTSTAIGDAKLTLSTPAGDSSNGNIPVLFIKQDDLLIQIGADFENFKGDKQSFIYVDKMFDTTGQFGELSQTSIDLSENQFKAGVHTVTAAQFENDDPAGKVINFVEAQYEVKEGK